MVSLLTLAFERASVWVGLVWFSSSVDYRLLACRFHIFTPSFDNRPRHAGVPV